ncbi:uncharacterized protein LOC127131799 [Lathyrus oleraceus]|uniref:uncharacterized protein LOC127131799 n=1 Tax=Pisum sativum TaxID=3888 RepID=UPI001FC57E85|nr:uncharacterized protein LOC127131799 [Pisum sativum]
MDRGHNKPVSIPVHSFGSERNITYSATKIQTVARGFLVRKSFKKMLKMMVEVEEINKKVNDEETVMMMKKEQKERIRMGETIMNLLLRLDSVRVFNCCALRDLRKLLIKRAIFLQEYVDQIQMENEKNEYGDEGRYVRAATKIQMVARGCLVRKSMKKMLKIKVELEEIETVMMMMKKKEQKERLTIGETIMDLLLRLDSVTVFHCSSLRELRKSLINRAIFLDESVDQIRMVGPTHEVKCEDEEEDEERLRRMMDENREMIRRMMDEKEKQTSVLTSLTQRVEQLERAFPSDKNRRYVVDAK